MRKNGEKEGRPEETSARDTSQERGVLQMNEGYMVLPGLFASEQHILSQQGRTTNSVTLMT